MSLHAQGAAMGSQPQSSAMPAAGSRAASLHPGRGSSPAAAPGAAASTRVRGSAAGGACLHVAWPQHGARRRARAHGGMWRLLQPAAMLAAREHRHMLLSPHGMHQHQAPMAQAAWACCAPHRQKQESLQAGLNKRGLQMCRVCLPNGTVSCSGAHPRRSAHGLAVPTGAQRAGSALATQAAGCLRLTSPAPMPGLLACVTEGGGAGCAAAGAEGAAGVGRCMRPAQWSV